MSARVDKNLMKIRDESEFVDAVDRRIGESAGPAGEGRKADSRAGKGVRRARPGDPAAVRDDVLGVVEQRVGAVAGGLVESEKRVKDFSSFLARLAAHPQPCGDHYLALWAAWWLLELGGWLHELEAVSCIVGVCGPGPRRRRGGLLPPGALARRGLPGDEAWLAEVVAGLAASAGLAGGDGKARRRFRNRREGAHLGCR